jgi:virulence-associated protein VapD
MGKFKSLIISAIEILEKHLHWFTSPIKDIKADSSNELAFMFIIERVSNDKIL